MESCRPAAQPTGNLPEDLVSLEIAEWHEMDVNEFNSDNVETIDGDLNHNIMSSSSFESCNFNMNQFAVMDPSFCYDTHSYTDCSQEMAPQQIEPMPYSYPNTYGVEYCPNGSLKNRSFCGYSPQGSLGDNNSSPDSSLNDNYRSDQNSNYTLLQSHSWPPDDQTSDDSVELELTPFENPSCSTTDNHMSFHAYRMKQADILPHFDKVFPPKHQKSSKRGRPVTYLRRRTTSAAEYSHYTPYSDSSDEDDRYSNKTSVTKCKRGAKNVLLWKFLLEELDKPDITHSQWVDRAEGLFRFVDTTEVSKLWGQKKNKEDMNFEKLSRGIRHYYREGLMARQEGTRLIYRFNWDLVPVEYRRF